MRGRKPQKVGDPLLGIDGQKLVEVRSPVLHGFPICSRQGLLFVLVDSDGSSAAETFVRVVQTEKRGPDYRPSLLGPGAGIARVSPQELSGREHTMIHRIRECGWFHHERRQKPGGHGDNFRYHDAAYAAGPRRGQRPCSRRSTEAFRAPDGSGTGPQVSSRQLSNVAPVHGSD